MSLLSRLRGKPKRLTNITVYALSAIIDGNVKASPLGTIPRFSNSYEKTIRDKHHPARSSYINESINGSSVILYWATEGVDAVSFLSADDARAFPGFSAIPDADLAKLDSVLAHFPR